jgi:hypothetical protein
MYRRTQTHTIPASCSGRPGVISTRWQCILEEGFMFYGFLSPSMEIAAKLKSDNYSLL